MILRCPSDTPSSRRSGSVRCRSTLRSTSPAAKTSQQSFLIVAGISLLSIFPAARLPKLPGEVSAEDIVSEASLERQGSESPVDSGSYRRGFGVESADAGANENEP